jgi:hypothetical protein
MTVLLNHDLDRSAALALGARARAWPRVGIVGAAMGSCAAVFSSADVPAQPERVVLQHDAPRERESFDFRASTFPPTRSTRWPTTSSPPSLFSIFVGRRSSRYQRGATAAALNVAARAVSSHELRQMLTPWCPRHWGGRLGNAGPRISGDCRSTDQLRRHVAAVEPVGDAILVATLTPVPYRRFFRGPVTRSS